MVRIAHELPGRIRICTPALHDPSLDPVYLEAFLQNIPGVEDIHINLRAASIAVSYDGNIQTRQNILNCLEDIPMEAFHPMLEKEQDADLADVIARGVMALLIPAFPRRTWAPLSWSLAMPTLLKGIETLLTKGIKVEVLDASVVGFSLLCRQYSTANSVVPLLKLGEYLEQLSEEKTGRLLKSLLRPQADTVWVERDGQEVKTSLDQLTIGETVLCGPGEMIPADGEVIHGDALVNQSSITGESVPVHVQPEDEVLSGSVVEEGHIKIRAGQVGSETTMARISRFLENSLRFKSKSEAEAYKLADKLVPITFALGMVIWLLTRDLKRAASVLTVDYSCAIKLASPVAVKMSMYNAAHCGVLLKGAQALESLASVDTIVFDKTGTLTRGVLEVTDVLPQGNMNTDELLALAAGAEEHYTHPVARAVVRAAKKRGLTLPAFSQVDFIVAHGVSAYVEGEQVLVGSSHFIAEDEGIDCSAAEDTVRQIRSQGKTILYVARGRTLRGVIALRDELRPEAPEVLKQLKERGIQKIIILTGDHQETARALAKNLEAVDEVYWELKPEDKSAIVKDLREQGHMLAFAGDGVNDAPALVTADVGICMPGGADLARESAQVMLMKEDLAGLVEARDIAVQARSIIKNCFNTGVGLNSLFLLLATGGIIPPVVSAVLHNLNTVGIIAYAGLAGRQTPCADITSQAEENAV